MQERLEDLVSVLEDPEVSTGRKGRVAAEADVRSLKLLLHVQRHHYKLVVVDPDLSEASSFFGQLILDLDYLVCEYHADLDETLPVFDEFLPHVVEVFEVVEQWPEDVLVE